MERRTIEQIKTWKLILNPMTDRTEAAQIVAISFDKDRLIDWYKSQLNPEPYKDDNWHKVFRQGGPLEWYNPIYGDLTEDSISHFGHGLTWEWAEENFVNKLGILLV